jgi:LmbE family N-acetylglucosaminyl deacetylase
MFMSEGLNMKHIKQIHAMVISAHPDDAEVGAAGTVARWTKEGKNIVYVVCTKGEKGTSDRNLSTPDLAQIRQREQSNAARIAGVTEVVFLNYVDQELEDTPGFRKEIVGLIRMFRPEIVITSDPYRRYIRHRDHRIVGQVVLDAVYPFARDHLAYPDLLEKGLEPHKVREILFWGAEEINYRVDITGTFDLKITALRCHESQFNGPKLKKMESWIKNRCRQMAEKENFDLAEGFHRVVIDY